jgi:hypothetical protein
VGFDQSARSPAHLFYLERRGKIFVEERDGLLVCCVA